VFAFLFNKNDHSAVNALGGNNICKYSSTFGDGTLQMRRFHPLTRIQLKNKKNKEFQ
jgi:hypothetical protein